MTSWLRAAALAGVIVSGMAQATTMVALDVPSLAQRSNLVVRGTVSSVTPRWSGDKRRILTDVVIDVAESFRGDAPKTVTVTEPGGVIGDTGQMVAGAAAFKQGEEVVVFLEAHGPSRFRTVGMSQGKFKVQRSTDGKAVMAVPQGAISTDLVDAKTHQLVVSPNKSLSVDDLRTQVKAVPLNKLVVPPGGP